MPKAKTTPSPTKYLTYFKNLDQKLLNVFTCSHHGRHKPKQDTIDPYLTKFTPHNPNP